MPQDEAVPKVTESEVDVSGGLHKALDRLDQVRREAAAASERLKSARRACEGLGAEIRKGTNGNGNGKNGH
jgi:hypothetical protein